MAARKVKDENLEAVTEVCAPDGCEPEDVVGGEDGCEDTGQSVCDAGGVAEHLSNPYARCAQVQMKGLAMAEKLLDDFGEQKPPYNEQQLRLVMTAMDLYNAFKA